MSVKIGKPKIAKIMQANRYGRKWGCKCVP